MLKLRNLLACLLVLACLPFAHGAAVRQELSASAAKTASGNSDSFKISTVTQGAVFVDLTAGSGTITDFDLWIEVSSDGGTTWYAMPPDVVVVNSTLAASWTIDADDAFIIDSKSSTTAEKWIAVYKQIAADYIRVRWTLTGSSTPTLTFSVRFTGK